MDHQDFELTRPSIPFLSRLPDISKESIGNPHLLDEEWPFGRIQITGRPSDKIMVVRNSINPNLIV
jgi:hypothetical protein